MDIEIQTDEVWNASISAFIQTAKSMWNSAAGLAVQAVLHYYKHGHDCSRCEQLYVAMEGVQLGSHLTAYQKFLRETTGITGFGTEEWKGKGRPIPDEEHWQAKVQDLADNGGAALMAYRAEKKQAPKKQGQRSISVRLPGDASEKVQNAAKAALEKLDGKTDEEKIAAFRAMEGTQGNASPPSILDQVQSPELREKLETFIEKVIEEEKVNEEEAIRSVDLFIGKLVSHIKNLLKPKAQEKEAA